MTKKVSRLLSLLLTIMLLVTNITPSYGALNSGGPDAKPDTDKAAFSEEKVVNDITVKVEAEEGVFPEGSHLSVETVYDTKVQEDISEKINSDIVNETGKLRTDKVVKSYTFDVKVLDKNDREIQPNKDVKISISGDMVKDKKLNTSLYHVNKNRDNFSVEKIEGSETGDTYTGKTDGFSYYTVEFTYDGVQFVLEGGETKRLEDILQVIGLPGTVEYAEGSNDELFSFEERIDGWYVVSHQAFDTTEWMKVRINGIEYEIVVTDAHSDGGHSTKTVYSSGTMSIIVSDGTNTDTYTLKGTWGSKPDYDDWDTSSKVVNLTLTAPSTKTAKVSIDFASSDTHWHNGTVGRLLTVNQAAGYPETNPNKYQYMEIPISVTCPPGYEYSTVTYDRITSPKSALMKTSLGYSTQTNLGTGTFSGSTTTMYFCVNPINLGMVDMDAGASASPRFYKYTQSSATYTFGLITYGLTYSLDDGSFAAGSSGHPATATYNSVFSVPAPSKTGYTFGGWSISGMDNGNTTGNTHYYGTSNPPVSTNKTASMSTSSSTDTYYFKNLQSFNNTTVTFSANWTPNVYTVTLDGQGATTDGTTEVYEKYGTGVYKNSSCSSSSSMTTSSNSITKPTRTGYTFGGYYTSENGGGTQMISASGYRTASFTSSYYSQNATLYAKWTPNTYTVTLNPYGGTYNSTTGTTNKTMTYGASTNSNVGVATRDNYIFKGWYDAETGGNMAWDNKGYAVKGTYWTEDNNTQTRFYMNSVSALMNCTYLGTDGTYIYLTKSKTSTSDTVYRISNSGTSYTTINNFDCTTLRYGDTATTVSLKGELYELVKNSSDFYIYRYTLNWSYANTKTFYARWEVDDSAPPVPSISSTNTVTSSQTITLSATDNKGVTAYYWGTSNNPGSSDYTSVTSTASWTKNDITISNSGTYYLFVKDAVGNEAHTSATFYETTFSVTNGSVTPTKVITMSGNSFPTPSISPGEGYNSPGQWKYDNGTKTVNCGENYKPTSSTTLSAECTNIPQYGVSVKTILRKALTDNTESTVCGTATGDGTYQSGQTATLKATAASTHYSFKGWATSASATTYLSTSATYSPTVSAAVTYYAIFQADPHPVTITKGTGISSVSGDGSYYHGDTVTISASVSTGYDWKNWTGSATTTSNPYEFTITEDVSFTANATEKEATLSYDNGGRGTTPESQQMKYTDVVYAADAITDGSPYVFAGWKRSDNDTIIPAGAKVKDANSIPSPLTLTAQWNTGGLTVIPTPYSGTYNGSPHSASITVSVSGAKVEYGTDSSYTGGTINSTTANTAHVMTGVSRTSVGTTTVHYRVTKDGYTPVTGTTTIEITEPTATLRYDAAETGVTMPADQTMNFTDATYTGTVTTPTGYNAIKWATSLNDAQSGTGTMYNQNVEYKGANTMPANATLYAHMSSTLSFDSNGHGTAPSAQPMYYKGNVSATAMSNADGYTFMGWATTDARADAGTVDYVGGALYKADNQYKPNATLHAVWQNAYTITALPCIKGDGTIDTSSNPDIVSGSGSYNQGSTATLIARDITGYTFLGWSNNTTSTTYATTSATYSPTVTGNNTYYAVYGKNVTLTKSAVKRSGTSSTVDNTVGTVTGPTSGVVTKSVTFTASPATGYQFAGWAHTKDSSVFSTNATLTMDLVNSSNSSDYEFYAIFTGNPYKVVFHPNTGTPDRTYEQSFAYGTAQNLIPNPYIKKQYVFDGWSETANGTKKYNDEQSISNLTSTSGGTINLYARWKRALSVVDSISGEVSSTDGMTYVIDNPNEESTSISFRKMSAAGQYLKGVKFYLNGKSTSGVEYINTEAVSDTNGTVTFNNVYEGSNYTITEDADSVINNSNFTGVVPAEGPWTLEVTKSGSTFSYVIKKNGTPISNNTIINPVENKRNFSFIKNGESRDEQLGGITFTLAGNSYYRTNVNKQANSSSNASDKGKVTFTDVPYGKYSMTEQGSGSTITVGGKERTRNELGWEVTVGDTITIKDKRTDKVVDDIYGIFNPPTTIDVPIKKIDENGDALSGVEFVLSEKDGGAFNPQTRISRSDGSLTFTDIPEGEYVIKEVSVANAPRKVYKRDDEWAVHVTKDPDTFILSYSIEKVKDEHDNILEYMSSQGSNWSDTSCTIKGTTTTNTNDRGVIVQQYNNDTYVSAVTPASGSPAKQSKLVYNFTKTSSWNRLKVGFNGNVAKALATFDCSGLENGAYTLSMYLDSLSTDGRGNGGVIKYVKLEKGNEATQWSPIPEVEYNATSGYKLSVIDPLELKRDIYFYKLDNNGNGLGGAAFKLYGTSKNGTDIADTGRDTAISRTASEGNKGVGYVEFRDVYYGTYQLKETYVSEEYKLSEEEYTVKVDDSGFTITDSKGREIEILDDYYVIRNKIFDIDLKVIKQDEDSNEPIDGAVYVLKSDENNTIEFEPVRATTGDVDVDGDGKNDKGLMMFYHLPIGRYTLKEETAPNGYEENTNVYNIVVARDSVTMTYGDPVRSAPKNDDGAFIVTDKIIGPVGHVVFKKIGPEVFSDGREDLVPGVTFTLDGISNYGQNVYKEDTTTEENGCIVTLDNIPQGSNYEADETLLPKGYKHSEGPWRVEVNGSTTYLYDERHEEPIHTWTKNDYTPYVVQNDYEETNTGFIIRKIDAVTKDVLKNVEFNISGIETSSGIPAEDSSKTKANGETTFSGLHYGEYTVVEAPYTAENFVAKYYMIDPISVSVGSDDKTVVLKQNGYTLEPVEKADGIIRKYDVYQFEDQPYQRFYIHKIDESQKELSGAEFRLVESDYEVEKYDIAFDGTNIYIYNKGTNNLTSDEVSISRSETAIKAVGGIVPAASFEGNEPKDGSEMTLNYKNQKVPFTLSESSRVTVKVEKDDIFSQTVVTAGNGRAEFKNIKEGSYKLIETRAPKNYLKIPTIYDVEVTRTDVTINGLTKRTEQNMKIFDIKDPIPKTKVRIRKQNSDEEPLAGAVYFVESETDEEFKTTTDVTGTDGIVTIENLKPGSYKITEISSPDNYLEGTEEYTLKIEYDEVLQKFKYECDSNQRTEKVEGVRGADDVITYPYTNFQYPDFRIKKVDEDGNPLRGAEFTVSNGNTSENIEQFTDENGYVTFKGIAELGTNLVITESGAPYGYVDIDDTWNLTIDTSSANPYTVKKNNTIPVTLEDLEGVQGFTVENQKQLYEFRIRKVDSVTGNPVSGAGFTLIPKTETEESDGDEGEGTTPEPVTTVTPSNGISPANGYVTWSDLPVGEYVLAETQKPNGYVTSQVSWTVKVDKPSEDNELPIKVIDSEGTEIAATIDGGSFYFKIENEPGFDVRIRKLRKGTENPVIGAGLDVSVSGGRTVEEFSSGAQPETITLTAGTYTLTEGLVPSGYKQADPIEFTVSNTGTVTSPTAGAASGNMITMYDDIYTGNVELEKKDDLSNPLAGAHFKLEGAATVGDTIVMTVTSGPIASGKAKILFENVPLGLYTLTETASPNPGTFEKDEKTYLVRVFIDENDDTNTVQTEITESGAVDETKTYDTIIDPIKYSDVTITKNVKGAYGDVTREFDFTFNMPSNIPHVKCTVAKNGGSPTELTADSNGNITYSFKLKDDDSITFSHVPNDVKFTVTEAKSNHVTTFITNAGKSGGNIIDDLAYTTPDLKSGTDTLVKFTNTRTPKPVTGVNSDIIPWIIAAQMIVLLSILYYIKRKTGFTFFKKK